ncbi:lipase maturation factor 1-like [Haliotis rufescens]|uniref:lipase maturation factor 1-like n=1 Tax=Haliotis rufescens TaxID=6454 RepID=UPI00201E98B9|nr:lipase maturation factor 1-like [Haliotis rufescens]
MSDSGPDRDISRNDSEVKEGTFWLARNVLLRCLGLIYFLAFLIALDQNRRLYGKDGLIPYKTSNTHLRDTINRFADTEQEAIFYHSLPYDNVLAFLTQVGLSLSLFLVFRGAANWLLMLCLWTIYHLLVDAGLQRHSFGWEFQLLETGFLATFLCPVWSLRQPPTSRAVIRGFKWMFFRIMWGWSSDKIRRDHDICSTYFTCMNYHYQTRPFSTDTNFPKTWEYQFYIYHVLAPNLLMYGRRMTIIAGAIGIFSQVSLIISGDLILFNWLNIVPCLACFDDRSVCWLLPGRLRRQIAYKQELTQTEGLKAFDCCLGLFIVVRSIPVLIKILEDQQIPITNEKLLTLP